MPADSAYPPAVSPTNITNTSKDGHGAAVFAGFLGWTLDAFDFFLVVLCLTAIAKEFHRSDKEIAFSITLTLAFRPVGAFIFGLLADRYGRRLPLMLDLIFYSVVEVATGFAHSFTTFLVLRALFGIGMGGEWGVGASLAMEKVPPRLRGFLSGLLQQGYALGNLLATGCFFFVFPRWGWRPMFFIGGLPALLALFVRFNVKESEVWQRTRQANWGSLGREILRHWKLFLYLTLLMMMMNFSSHGTQDMFPTFLKRFWSRTPTQVAGINAMWAYAPTVTVLVIGAFLIQFMVQGAWGIIPAHLSELSPDSVRGFLPGFAYQCGVLLASTVPTIEAILAEHTSYANAMALTALTVFTLAIIVVAVGREKKGIQFGSAP